METRREFLKAGFSAATGAVMTGCVTRHVARAQALAGDCAWGALLHLGSNMWKDWSPDGKYPRSFAEERQMIKEGKIEFKSSRLYCNRDYFSTNWESWNRQLECVRNEGLRMVFIDVGESYAYPSHPELWVDGSLGFDEMQSVLERIREMGLEPIPKLNFSTGHDQWLREYHFMTSSSKYYQMVADVVRDTCEVFNYPRYFHIGFDEEILAFCGPGRRQLCVMRLGDLWWKDFFYCVGEVEKAGARAVLWSDKICSGKDEFLKRMPKSVLQMPWFYGNDFSKEHLTWRPQFEKSQAGDIQCNLAAALDVIAANGYDVMPCTSNWLLDDAADAMLAYCKEHLDPSHVKGYITAPWRKPVPEDDQKMMEGVRLFAKAKRKYFG